MDVKKLESRNTSLDIVRVVAVFLVNSVHFFLYNGFYSEPIKNSTPMFIMMIMRTFFTTCVPLFMILTGYLMSQKTLSKGYYKGIRKTLVIYGVATVACIAFKTFSLGEEFTLGKGILDFLSFKGATYSWYIEFYIGLFLIAPFLNLMYNGLKTQRKKQVLVFTFFAVSILPTILNIHVFSNLQWWANPTISTEYEKLVPAWWGMVYPVAYYLVGAYLREYGFKMKTRTLLIGYSVVLVLFSAYNFYRYFGTAYSYGTLTNWNCFEAYVLSCGLFILLTRIPTGKMPVGCKWALWKLSDLALGIYLISYIFDYIIYYNFLNKNVTVFDDKLPWYFVVVPIVFVLSAAASFLMNLVAKYLISCYEALIKFIKKQRARDDKEKWRDIIFAVLFAGAVGFAIWKCFYGFGGLDEAFYITIPQRFLQGDSPFLHEWHLGQTSFFIHMPFIWAFRGITGSYEGIMFAARIYYVILHAAVSVAIYTRLRKYGYITVFASILFFIFTPFDIMAYSYNTSGLDLVVLSGVLLATANYNHKIPLILSGLFFAGAVLCNPYLLAVYALYVVCVIIHMIIKKKEMKFVLKSEMFSLKTLIWFTIGAAILAVITVAFILSRTSINDIMATLPKMLDDPEHAQLPFFARLGKYFNCIFTFHPQFIYAVYAYAITLIVLFFDKKRRLHRSLYLIVSIALTAYTFVLMLPTLTVSSYNSIMFPMIFVGITSYILLDKKPREIFAAVFILGVLYSIAMCFSSNQYFYVVSAALTAANIGSYVFLAQLIREMKETEDNLDYAKLMKCSAVVMTVLIISLQAFLQLTVKANHCFWDSSTGMLNETISQGPAKGITTTRANVESYDNYYKDIQQLKQKPEGNVLFLTNATWLYLALDYPFATICSAVGDENITPLTTVLSRLDVYYAANPDKVPKYVYVPKTVKWDTNAITTNFRAKGYNVSETDNAFILEK